MKTQLLLTVLLLLPGCGDLEHLTQPQVRFRKLRRLQRPLSRLLNRQSQQQPRFTGKVIRIVDGDTIDMLTDDNQAIRTDSTASIVLTA